MVDMNGVLHYNSLDLWEKKLLFIFFLVFGANQEWL